MTEDIYYYKKIFGGEYPEEIIAPCLERARDIILGAVTVREYSTSEENAVSRAVCIQAEEYAACKAAVQEDKEELQEDNGGEEAAEVRYSSVKLGDFSVSFKDTDTSSSSAGSGVSSSSAAAEKVSGICERAAAVLDRHGLFYRGGVLL